MISFTCTSCHKKLSIQDDRAGKKLKCPGCGTVMQAPAPPPERFEVTHDPTSPGLDGQASLTSFLAPAQAADELGRLGGFRILKILGRGGMGVVYQGEDPKLGRKVAIKAMLPQLAENQTAQQRFLREAKAAAALEHDHVVPIFHVGEDRGAPFIVMPFLKGEPLDRRLEGPDKLAVAEILRIGREMAEGLGAAHAVGLIHRDIKPANIWLEEPKSRVKILDFGLARPSAQAGEGLTQLGAIVGTPAYMAPEQARGAKVDGRCDLWSLGVVLYRMCTGRVPFQGTDAMSTLLAAITDEPPAPAVVNAEVPAGLSDLVMRLLAKDPQQRPANAQEVVEALREVEKELQATSVWPSLPTPQGPADSVVARRRGGKVSDPKGEPKDVQRRAEGRQPPGDRPTRGLTPLGSPTGKRRLLLALAGAGVVVLLAVLLLFWLTPHGKPPGPVAVAPPPDPAAQGLVRIDSADPGIEIVFDKTGPRIKGSAKEPISLPPGEHSLVIKRGDFTFEPNKLVVKKGETITLKIEVLQGKVQVKAAGRLLGGADLPPVAVVPPPPLDPRLKTFNNSLGMAFVLVPRGKFWMGGGAGKPGDKEVEIPQDFYLGMYLVTQEEWQTIMEKNPSYFSRTGVGKDKVKDISDADLKRFPVEAVSWDDCQEFVKKLNEKVKDNGWEYRLPTEAQWEYACRGGPGHPKEHYGYDFYLNSGPTNKLPADKANLFETKLQRTCKVDTYPPNSLGLYGMHGNVWGWCADEFSPGAPRRAFRGSAFDYPAGSCRAAARSNGLPPAYRSNGSGLRLSRVPVGAQGK